MTVEYRIKTSEDYLVTSFDRFRRQSRWHRRTTVLRWIGVVIIAVGLVTTALAGDAFLATILAGCLIMFIAARPLRGWVVRRAARRSPHRDDEIVFKMSEKGTHAVGAQSRIRTRWDTFTSACRFEDGLLLLQGPHLFNWLPDAAAADAETVAQAQELVRAHVGDIRRV